MKSGIEIILLSIPYILFLFFCFKLIRNNKLEAAKPKRVKYFGLKASVMILIVAAAFVYLYFLVGLVIFGI